MISESTLATIWQACGVGPGFYDEYRRQFTDLLPVTITTSRFDAASNEPIARVLRTFEEVLLLLRSTTWQPVSTNILNYHRLLGPGSSPYAEPIIKALVFGVCQRFDSPICRNIWAPFTKRILQSERMVNFDMVLDPNLRQRKSGRKGAQLCYVLKSCRHHTVVKIVFLCTLSKLRSAYDGLNELFPAASAGDWAHTRLDLETTLCAAATTTHLPAMVILKNLNLLFSVVPVGAYNSMITGLIIGIMSSESVLDLVSDFSVRRFCCLNNVTLLYKLRMFSDAVRRTHALPSMSHLDSAAICSLSYWHMCSSRQLSASDWDKERNTRATYMPVGEVASCDYRTRVYKEIDLAIAEVMHRAKRTPSSWEEFVINRQRYVSSGSTGGIKTTISGRAISAGKRVYFENVPTAEIVSWLQSVPIMQASASEKFELGKSRAIYGTQPKDFLIMTYVLDILENAVEELPGVQHRNTMPHSMARIHHRLTTLSTTAPYALMLDYSNFNIQHTLDIQAQIFRCIARTAIQMHWPASYVQAATWCANSILNSWTIYPDTRENFRIRQGLFSGSRGTAFMNSLLNYCYYSAATYVYKQLSPSSSVNVVHYHQGDDVWVTSNDEAFNVVIYHIMMAAGLVFEPSKQNIAHSVGEFLRVWYDGTRVHGFIARAIASLIISPLQSEPGTDLIEEARALDSQLRVLCRRGLPSQLAAALWKSLVVYKVRKAVSSGDVSDAQLLGAISTSSIYGGIGCPNPAKPLVWRSPRLLPQRPVLPKRKEIPVGAGSYMSSDLISSLALEVAAHVDISTLAMGLRRCNYSGLRSDDRPEPETVALYNSRLLRWVRSFNMDLCMHGSGCLSNGKGTVAISSSTIADIVNEEVNVAVKLVTLDPALLRQHRDTTFAAMYYTVLANSPFTSVEEIKSAAACSTYDAYMILIQTCRNEAAAGSLLARLTNVLSSSMAIVRNFWLDNIASMPAALVLYWHPDLASYIHAHIFDRLFSLCSLTRLADIKKTAAICFEAETALITRAMEEDILRAISYY